MKYFLHVLLLLLLLIPLSSQASVLSIDRSYSVFFPKGLGEQLQGFQSFPASRWNFVTLDGVADGDESTLLGFCRAFTEGLRERELPALLACDGSPKNFSAILSDWSTDLPLRENFRGLEDLHKKMNVTFSKAMLPVGRELIEIFRLDPFESYEELRRMIESRFSLSLERRGGLFFDPQEKRLAFPLHLPFAPSETKLTREVFEAFQEKCQETKLCERLGLMGPHPSTLENESLIDRDLQNVSTWSLVAFALLLLALILARAWKAMIFVPVVIVGVGLAALVTALVFGSVHGLTLSFGSGIVGLCVDYGFLGLFGSTERSTKKVWMTNFAGIATTAAVFGTVGLSSIPLLRQISFFSIAGLLIASSLLLLVHRLWPRGFYAKPLPWKFSPRVVKAVLVFSLALLALLSPLFVKPSFDMGQFNTLEPRSALLNRWFFEKSAATPPLFEIHANEPNPEELKFASERNLRLDHPLLYLPSRDDQAGHLETWKSLCENVNVFTPKETQFFKPFLTQLRCTTRDFKEPAEVPGYISHLFFKTDEGSSRWLTLWLPKDNAESESIRSQFPNATSLKALVSSFPLALTGELRWMAPLSLFLVGLLLYLYFRKISLVPLALLPFLSGAGTIVMGALVFGLPFSFVSLLGLLMVYGFSVDYGVFSVDAHSRSHLSESGACTAIFFAALSTGLGFVPLLFCKHPVLHQLGQTLVLGTFGAFLGGFWGVPYLLRKRKERT